MTKIELLSTLGSKNTGWMIDRWGNFSAQITHYLVTKKFVHKETGAIRLVEARKETDDSLYRLKIQANSVRFEKKVSICGKNEWMKITSGYIKDLEITEVGGENYLNINGIKFPLVF